MTKPTPQTVFSFAFITEVLSSPKVKAIAKRLRPDSVWLALKEVFDDASRELLSSATERRLPDVNELVERAVERLKALVGVVEPLEIDARGRILPDARERLAPVAMEEGCWALVEPDSDSARRRVALREKDALAKLARLGGSEAAAVFPNREIARIAVLAALASEGRSLVVARRDLFERENGDRLEDAFAAVQNLLRREIGACNAVSREDYERAIDAGTGLVWRSFGRWSLGGRAVLASEIARLKGVSGRAFDVLGEFEYAPLLDFSEFFDATIPTVAERLKNGFDLVLCDGSGLIGGPSLGLVFGSRERIDAISRTTIARVVQTERARFAQLVKTLELSENRDVAFETIPVARTVSTSIANLESRAKRLAALLETCEVVQLARAIEGRSTLCSESSLGTIPTRLVEIRPRGFSSAEFAARLEKSSPRVLARWTPDVVLLDVRTIAPDQDGLVADLFERLSNPDALDNLRLAE